MDLDELRSLFAYDSWANDILLAAIQGLPEETLQRDLGASHKSVFGTMVHVVAAEEIWISRWKGAPRAKLTSTEEIPSMSALLDWWSRVREERDAYVSSLQDADVEGELEMSTTTGTKYRHRFSDMFRHMANHSSYHRGQVALLLRQLGEKPPSTDLIRFYREAR